MFSNAELFIGDLSKYDVSSVTGIDTMFYYAVCFDGDLQKWDVSGVTDMDSMFIKRWLISQDEHDWKSDAAPTINAHTRTNTHRDTDQYRKKHDTKSAAWGGLPPPGPGKLRAYRWGPQKGGPEVERNQ